MMLKETRCTPHPRPPRYDPPERLMGGLRKHVLTKLYLGGKKKVPQRLCRVCGAHQRQSLTSFICNVCGVSLHKVIISEHTKNGNPVIILGEYRYLVQVKSGRRIWWQCAKQRRMRCKARLTTDDYVIVKVTEEQLPEWASIYYLKDLTKEKEMKCNLCDVVINADEKSLLLLDHIKDKHKEVFELHKDNPEANVGFRIEFLHLNVMKDDGDPKSEPILLGEVCEATTVPLVKVPEPATDKDDEINTQYVMHKKKKKRSETTEARKRSWVWKYFDKLSNIIYRCNLCHVVLSIKGCNTNNMNRHVRTRHPHIFREEIVKRDGSESYDLNSEVETPFAIKTEEIYASDRDLEDMLESTSQKLRRSWIWSYFERVSAAQAQCKLCRRHITHGGNATGNMNRHLKMIHNKTGFEGDDRNDNSWVWKVFEASDDDAYTCKICQYRCDKYSSEDRSVASMLHHLKQEHGVVSGDQIITGTDCDDDN